MPCETGGWRCFAGSPTEPRVAVTSAHGLAMLAVSDELLVVGVARLRVVVGLKYHEGAVEMIGVVLGAAKMRTSSSWYPWRS